MKQPEALWLADAFDSLLTPDHAIESKAAAELRRLHGVNQELLDALKAISEFMPTTSAKEGGASAFSENVRAADKVRAAITKAGGAA